MATPSDSGLVYRYYLYRATLSFGFITPIFTLFLLRTLSFTEVGALSALYSLLSIGGEIPTGYIGDRFGRRTSLLLSVVFTVASLAGFIVTSGFLWYAVLYALWAVGLTFRSGSRDAWLYDTLDDRLDPERFSHIRGRGDAVQNLVAAITMIIGGLLYGLDPVYPFMVAVAFNSLGILTLLALPKNRQYDDPDRETAPLSSYLEAIAVIRDRLTQPPLRAVVLYLGLFYAVIGVAHTYVQPMAIETLAPIATDFGVDLPTEGAIAAARSGEATATLALGLGVLYALLTGVASIGGYYAGRIESRFGVRTPLVLIPVVTAVSLVIPLQLAVVALPMFAAMRTARPIVKPIANGYINDHVDAVGRATLLSAVSMFTMLLRTPLAVGAGMFADATTATTTVAALGGLFLLVGGVIWVVADIVPDNSTTTKQRTPDRLD